MFDGGRGGSPKIEPNCAAAGATRIATKTRAEAAAGVRRPITKRGPKGDPENQSAAPYAATVWLVNTGNTAAKGRSVLQWRTNCCSQRIKNKGFLAALGQFPLAPNPLSWPGLARPSTTCLSPKRPLCPRQARA